MKKIIWTLCLSLCCCQVFAMPLDSLKVLLHKYTQRIERSSAETKASECDYLISSSQDSSVRAFTAQTLFSHYAASKIMNDEAVCVQLFDRWFANKKVRFQTEEDYLAARVFTETHRYSLVGMKAPELTLQTPEGEEKSIPEAGKMSLLFFYASDCAVCKLYSKQLEVVLARDGEGVCTYAIYTGNDVQAWESYRRERLNWKNTGKVVHLWDPEGESRYAFQYGIVSTPRIFLCDEEGVILGRGLDPAALQQLLQKKQQDEQYSYGEPEAMELYAQLLPQGQQSEAEVEEIVQYLKWVSLERNDASLYRHLLGDLMYYLSHLHNEESIQACDYLIQQHILSGKVQWKGENDQLAVVHLAKMLQSLHGKSAIGSSLPAIYVHLEECRNQGKGLVGKFRLDQLKKRCRLAKKELLLLFYDPSCENCKEQLEKARNNQDKNTCIFLINVEENEILLDTAEWDELMEQFDLSTLPYLLLFDKEGKLSRRYFHL